MGCAADPFLRVDPLAYWVCVPLRVAVGGLYLAAPSQTNLSVALGLVVIVLGLLYKRHLTKDIPVWKNYDRAVLMLGSASVGFATGHSRVAGGLILADALAGLTTRLRCVSCD